jgi:hypothetical protein
MSHQIGRLRSKELTTNLQETSILWLLHALSRRLDLSPSIGYDQPNERLKLGVRLIAITIALTPASGSRRGSAF